MPADTPRITLILLDSDGSTLQATASDRMPALELMMARAGDLTLHSLPTNLGYCRWQSQVLARLGVQQAVSSAALSWFGSGGEWQAGTWLHATPMHYSVTLNGLSMHRVTWTEADAQVIEKILSRHLAQDGFAWRRIGREIYLHHAELFDVNTVASEWASRMPLRGIQPSGKQARTINQLATEIQMLLHENPKLQRRSMPINTLWLWGNQSMASAAEITTTHQQALPNAWSSEPFVKGLCLQLHSQCNELLPLKAIAENSSNDVSDDVIVARTRDLQTAEAEWFAPLLTALRGGVWSHAHIVMGDVEFSIKKSDLWRFWRRAQPLNTQLQAQMDQA
jgi:hypothetical protein